MVKVVHTLVQPDCTVLQMLQKLHKKNRVPIHEMQLWYNTQRLEENRPLSSYGIADGTNLTLKTFERTGTCSCEECLRMQTKITVTVTRLSKSMQVEMSLGETVESLKEAICKLEGIAVAKQKLTLNGQPLEDHKLLATYKFGDEESGGMGEPVVHLFVGTSTPTVLGKLRSLVSFRGFNGEPPAAPVAACLVYLKP